jgi:hypothetical protein
LQTSSGISNLTGLFVKLDLFLQGLLKCFAPGSTSYGRKESNRLVAHSGATMQQPFSAFKLASDEEELYCILHKGGTLSPTILKNRDIAEMWSEWLNELWETGRSNSPFRKNGETDATAV